MQRRRRRYRMRVQRRPRTRKISVAALGGQRSWRGILLRRKPILRLAGPLAPADSLRASASTTVAVKVRSHGDLKVELTSLKFGALAFAAANATERRDEDGGGGAYIKTARIQRPLLSGRTVQLPRSGAPARPRGEKIVFAKRDR
jgi:hypothetical protein